MLFASNRSDFFQIMKTLLTVTPFLLVSSVASAQVFPHPKDACDPANYSYANPPSPQQGQCHRVIIEDLGGFSVGSYASDPANPSPANCAGASAGECQSLMSVDPGVNNVRTFQCDSSTNPNNTQFETVTTQYTSTGGMLNGAYGFQFGVPTPTLVSPTFHTSVDFGAQNFQLASAGMTNTTSNFPSQSVVGPSGQYHGYCIDPALPAAYHGTTYVKVTATNALNDTCATNPGACGPPTWINWDAPAPTSPVMPPMNLVADTSASSQVGTNTAVGRADFRSGTPIGSTSYCQRTGVANPVPEPFAVSGPLEIYHSAGASGIPAMAFVNYVLVPYGNIPGTGDPNATMISALPNSFYTFVISNQTYDAECFDGDGTQKIAQDGGTTFWRGDQTLQGGNTPLSP